MRVNPQERRKKATVEVTIGGGATILCRRLSVLTAVLTGNLPLRLMKAGEKFAAEHGDATYAEMADALGKKENAETAEMIDRVVCIASLDPKVVMEGDGDPNHMLITELEFDERMAIFKEVTQPAALAAAPITPEIPELRTEEAREEFRGAVAPAPSAPAPARQDVQPAPERVVDGRVVEFVGQ